MPYRSVNVQLKRLSENEVAIIKHLAIESRRVYNLSLELIEAQYTKVKTLPKYTDILKTLNDSQELKGIGYGFEAVIKTPLTAYKTYISRQRKIDLSKQNPSWKQLDDNINPPQKSKYCYLHSEKFRKVDDCLQFPIPYDLYQKHGALKLYLPKRYQNLKIKKVCIQYDPSFTHFKMVLDYQTDVQTNFVKNGDYRALAIDIGVANFASCATSEGDSFIIDGRHMKSIIQGYEKYTALDKKDKAPKSKLAKIRQRKENQIEDYLNKSVSYIISYCRKHKIGNIIMGYNPRFKKSINMGKENNQLFFQMPYTKFMNKLNHQCQTNGITFTKTYECYTSKASFLDGDDFPGYLTGEKQNFSGKRRYRGLYVASDGRKINADINAAGNILSKCKAISSEKLRLLRCRGFAQPLRINPLIRAGCN